MKMIALLPFVYANRWTETGKPFSIRPQDATILKAIGRAEYIIETKAPKPKRSKRTKEKTG